MLSQPERNALARELGLTSPWLWGDEIVLSRDEDGRPSKTTRNTLLPCPLSDDPAACQWDGAFMRAIGWRPIMKSDNGKFYARAIFVPSDDDDEGAGDWLYTPYCDTPTAALYAAWKEIKPC